MLGFLTAISVAAAGVAKHLMDVNKAEKEKKEKDEEIQRLKEELEAEQMRKRQLQAEQDLQRFRKTMAEKNTLEYIKGIGFIIEMRIKAAEFEAQLDVNDPDYAEKLKQCEKLKQMLDESERINEIDFGENKPRDMSREEMYNYYVEHFREDDMKQDAHAEAAVTMEEINKANEDLVKVINKLKANLVKMEENLVNDGSEKYKRDLQDIKDTKEKISILEGRLMDDQE